MKIVLDTNILLACIGRRSPYRWLFDAIIDGRIALALSTEIIFEYQEILERKTTRNIADNVVSLLTIHPKSELIEVHFNFNLISTDKADNKFVDCYIASNADHLVSNDSHFGILKKISFPRVSILTLDEFEQLIQEEWAS